MDEETKKVQHDMHTVSLMTQDTHYAKSDMYMPRP